MTGFLTWLPDVLRDAGVPINVLPGASTRTTRASGLDVLGVVWHDTVTGKNVSDDAVRRLLRDGRSDLGGPLSQVGVPRSGVWDIIALGRCNHNGYGEWGNDSIGLEFYNNGTTEPFTPQQMETGQTGTAAILKHLGLTAARCKGHKETNPTRKIDPPLVDMPTVRLVVARRMVIQPPAPTPVPVNDPESEMFFAREAGTREVLFFEPERATHVPTRADVTAHAAALGLPAKEAEVSAEYFARLKRDRHLVTKSA